MVRDAATFRVATEIMFAAFEMPAPVLPVVAERYADFAIGPRAIQTVYLATLEGRPVATSLALAFEDVVGIHNVATLPDARRRGAGTAVTTAG